MTMTDTNTATSTNTTTDTNTETFAFQAEINQLLSLIINTFYSNKEVFLRELVSNASDAIDKVRYLSLTNPEVLGEDNDFKIKIIPDKESNTLTIWDNGIGMTKEDVIKNLGTIAHSGTRAFMEAIQAGNQPDVSLIGQFGVGFYSAFLVAHKVKVITKHNDDEQYVWESNAGGSFTLRQDSSDPIPRGTKIILELKEDQKEYTEDSRIRGIIKKHSEFCSFPIMNLEEHEEEIPEEPKEDTPKEDAPKEDTSNDEVTVDDVESEDENTSKPPPAPKTRKVKSFVQLNTQPPIWLRKPEEVTNEEHATFYKSISNDWDDHLAVKHFSVDGQVQFKSVLYVPKRAPFDMFNMEKKHNNIKLYVKKVLITDDSETMLPDYMSFVKGVVDSDDLPLNVSREMLQQNSIMKVIKNNLVKKVIEMINDLATSEKDEDKGKYATFYESFNKNIKLGIHEDKKNSKKLVELVRYYSSKSEETPTSLRNYVTRMKEGQKKIYYVTGESIKSVRNSPFIEKLKKKGFEVLYMVDPIDEYMVQALREYDDKELVCCSKEGLELEQSEEEKKQSEELAKEWEPVCNKIKNTLESRVQSVKLSERLADNPCVLVTDRYGWSANMERIMKAQALRNTNDMMGTMGSRKIMEINPDHVIMQEIKKRCDEDKNVKDIIEMLYNTVLLDSGFSLDEPSKYAQQIYKLINLGLTGNTDEDIPEVHEIEAAGATAEKENESIETIMEEVD
jgi:molecular chaperone HtpG